MRVGIQAWGSEGDIRPFLALGGALAAAGHDVSLVVTDLDDRTYEQYAGPLGIRVRMVARPDARHLEMLKTFGPELLALNPFEQGKLISARLFEPIVPAMFDAATELCATSDLVVGHFFHYPLRTAAERAGVPEVSVTLAADLVPSRDYPPTGLPDFGRIANRLWWGIAGWAVNRSFLPPVNRLRAKVGLPPLRTMEDAWRSRLLNLVAVSPALAPTPSDWGPQHRVSGFLSLPTTGVLDVVPPAVSQFLENGPAPVYAGFGSLAPKPGIEQDEVRALVEGAVVSAGCRGLLQGFGKDGQDSGDERILHVARLPHGVVFPACAAAVHHGGAGTTQTAVSAGVPSVIVPHVSDQFSWGALLHRRGVAPPPIPRAQLTVGALSAGIREALSPPMRKAARDLGARVRLEDGAREAVRLIEEAGQRTAAERAIVTQPQ